MKRFLLLLLHAIVCAPIVGVSFLCGWVFWAAYAGFMRAREVQIWLTSADNAKTWKVRVADTKEG